MNYSFYNALSDDQCNTLSSLAGACILPSLCRPGTGELVTRFKTEKANAYRKKLEEAADLLEASIVDVLRASGEEIMEKLRSAPYNDMAVEVFSYNFVSYNDDLQSKLSRRSHLPVDEQVRLRQEDFQEKYEMEELGWNSMISTQKPEEYDGVSYMYTVFEPVKISDVFDKTDLSLRIACALGPNFYPTYRYKNIHSTEGNDGYRVYEATLTLKYYPFGVSHNQMKRLLKCFSEKQARDSTTLRTLQEGEILKSNGKILITPDLPPLPPPVTRVRLLGKDPCHCGYHCHDEDD